MSINRLLGLGLAVLFALGVASSSQAGDWSKIRIGTEGAYAPFNYRDAAGKLQGFRVAIVQAPCHRMGAPCQVGAVPFHRITRGLQNNQIDATATSTAI